MQGARHVRLDEAALQAFGARYQADGRPVPAWDARLHFSEGTWRTANYVLVLDALNFCFWADPGAPRWSVPYLGQSYGGYWGLAAALRRSIEERVPLLDARFLAEIASSDVARILKGEGEIPMLDRRVANLREVGRLLVARYDGRFANAIEAAGFDAVNVAALLRDELSSFHDVATYGGLEVPLLKRAQIVAVDLYGTFAGASWGALQRLEALTAFADYKVPQVLRALGILAYDEALAEVVDRRDEIPAGDPREVEIRAATVHAVERIREAVASRGPAPRAFEIDWYLWGVGQEAVANERPYHRTRTVYY